MFVLYSKIFLDRSSLGHLPLNLFPGECDVGIHLDALLVAVSSEGWVLEGSGSPNKNQNTFITDEKSGWDCVPELAHVHYMIILT